MRSCNYRNTIFKIAYSRFSLPLCVTPNSSLSIWICTGPSSGPKWENSSISRSIQKYAKIVIRIICSNQFECWKLHEFNRKFYSNRLAINEIRYLRLVLDSDFHKLLIPHKLRRLRRKSHRFRMMMRWRLAIATTRSHAIWCSNGPNLRPIQNETKYASIEMELDTPRKSNKWHIECWTG